MLKADKRAELDNTCAIKTFKTFTALATGDCSITFYLSSSLTLQISGTFSQCSVSVADLVPISSHRSLEFRPKDFFRFFRVPKNTNYLLYLFNNPLSAADLPVTFDQCCSNDFLLLSPCILSLKLHFSLKISSVAPPWLTY